MAVKTKDLTGQKIGYWSVLGISPERSKNGILMFDCICECGKRKDVFSHLLNQGKTKSCGCNRNPGKLPKRKCSYPVNKNEAVHNSLNKFGINTKENRRKFSNIFRGAQARGLELSLELDFVSECLSKKCHYCSSDKVTGLDRVDNSQGYVMGNVVPCCKICNIAKSTLSQDDFKTWVNTIYQNWASK